MDTLRRPCFVLPVSGMVWCGMVGMVWYGMVWYGMAHGAVAFVARDTQYTIDTTDTTDATGTTITDTACKPCPYTVEGYYTGLTIPCLCPRCSSVCCCRRCRTLRSPRTCSAYARSHYSIRLNSVSNNVRCLCGRTRVGSEAAP